MHEFKPFSCSSPSINFKKGLGIYSREEEESKEHGKRGLKRRSNKWEILLIP